MLARWLWIGLMMLVEGASARRDARHRLVMTQLETLKARLPGNRVILASEERKQLLRLGSALGHEVHDALGIVTVKTYKRWLREQSAGRVPGRVVRLRKITASLWALILRLAGEHRLGCPPERRGVAEAGDVSLEHRDPAAPRAMAPIFCASA